MVELGSSQWGRSAVLRQLLMWWLNSPWAPGNFCGVSIVIVVVVVFLFGSCAGTCQIRDQSRALEDRNDSNNSLEVHTPNSFIHLLYNSPYMDIVDMHNVMVTPSDSVLWEKTMETSYLVGSFPCQLSQISLTSLFRMRSGNRQPLGISTLCGRLLTAIPVSPLDVVVRTLVSRIPRVHLYLSQQIGVRSSKTSQCGSANRPSVVPQGSPRIWCLSKSLLVSQIAVSVCRHDLPPCTTRWVTPL